MSVMESAPPSFGLPDAERLAAELFGLKGQAKALVSERDQNFLIRTPDGGAYVLKIANAAEDAAALEVQNAAMAHLAAQDPDLGVPRVHAATDGSTAVAVKGADGEDHVVRLVSFLPGGLYADAQHGPEQQRSLGAFMGRLDRAFQGFHHPAAHRPDFIWNLDNVEAAFALAEHVEDPEKRALVDRWIESYRARVAPCLAGLRWAAIHNDANDRNLLVADGAVTGLIDFGDMVWGRQINELAVTLAYALLEQDDPMAAAAEATAGYHAAFPLMPQELAVLWGLTAARLTASVCVSSWRAGLYADNDYLLVSQAPAFQLLERMEKINPEIAHFGLRQACGFEPVPGGEAIAAWLAASSGSFASILGRDLRRAPKVFLSMASGAPGVEHAADPQAYSDFLDRYLAENEADIAVGGYLEDRVVYLGDGFAADPDAERRTVHLGLDLFARAGTAVHAPLDGRLVSAQDNAGAFDYGPTLILEHDLGPEGPRFWTLYGHLSRESLAGKAPGQRVAKGEEIGAFGGPDVNGGWAPHVHFQVMTDLMGLSGDFPGVGERSRLAVWRAVCLDPNLILDLPAEALDEPQGRDPAALLAARKEVLGPSLSVSYAKPLKIVRGEGAWLIDQRGRAYLDCVNNICHVGHSHPKVVEALSCQAAVLNTNTRYLHDTILDYAERLAATMPGPLSVCLFVCSGSEANELALRLARTATGRKGGVVLEQGYHGNTSGLIDISPYKCEGKGGQGLSPLVRKAERPDPYRGSFRGYGRDAAQGYARSVAEAVEDLQAAGLPPAFFIAESIQGVGGQVIHPEGYLEAAYEIVRAAGGLCIADEVQVGFGRVGSHMWAFETQGVVPDIVSLGKPIGNGHPLACVVTTPEIAQAFANGMEYFNSFGGNPVSCAVGMAVLDVIEQEGLQANAANVGGYLMERFEALKVCHPMIGDVRGLGLFLGIELVRDRDSLEPATEEAGRLVNLAKDRGVLLSTDGPFENVIKMKPPICFSRANADLLVETLDAALASL